jgi:hypothetical protein
MSYSQQKLEQFRGILSKCDDDGVTMADIEKAFLAVVKTPQPDMVSNGKVKKTTTLKKSKKMSGYTLFLSQTMTGGEVKMKDAVKMWQQLSEDEKTEWKNEVNQKNSIEEDTEVVEKKEKKEKKWCGYTLFMSETMRKNKIKMGEAAKSWKNLPEKDKKDWNEKAKNEK